MAYSYRSSITIDHTKISGTDNLSNFQVLISGTYDGTGGEPDLKTAANSGHIQNTASGGISGAYTVPADLAFYNDTSQTTKYDHEVEFYDAATGEIVIWVEVPSVSYTDDTVFYMFYGDSGVSTSQENIAGVWATADKGIWHLAESGNGTANEFKDSSGKSHHGRGGDGNSSYTPSQVAGQVGKGQQSNGDDFITVADHADLDITGNITYRGWWYKQDHSNFQWLVCKGDGSFAYNWTLFSFQTTGVLQVWGNGGTSKTTTGAPNTTAWNHIAVKVSGTDLKVFINGSAESFSSYTIGPANNYPLYLMWNNYTGQLPPNGTKYDEIRVTADALTDGWIITEYNNQNAPGTFYTMGAETVNDIPQLRTTRVLLGVGT